jgi:hypothetical protein
MLKPINEFKVFKKYLSNEPLIRKKKESLTEED